MAMATLAVPIPAIEPQSGGSTSSSCTPSVMYSWRVAALDTWIARKEAELGRPITMKDMMTAGHLDQYHYLGLDANDDVIQILQVGKDSRILDIGCGIGGPGRYIAHKTGCSVYGVDIQEPLIEAANRVSKKVGLATQTKFDAADCTAGNFTFPAGETYDGFFSILVFLHIPLEPRLIAYRKIFAALNDNASFVIEDYLQRESLSEEERYCLENVIGAVCTPSVDDYRKHLEDIGFVDIHFEDLSDVWTKWTVLRRDRFLANRGKQAELHGEEHVAKMETFYRAPPQLFQSGKVGGYRITGRKAGNTTLAAGRKAMEEKRTNEMTMEAVERILDAQKTVSA
ncbi:unnamed protein product [Amoebophrya sp. A25]|nr:unnamed protein product [Amoebophrya sp. A25]|eukprot:GSA25T00015792001.1